ncbi:hypothetical protein GLOIN_2v1471016 [Rhizophagus irregularis DAOM 181602=DAOM 197198]|uniref:Uncharacterized protein n=1 Tax=Rhizophagus irregularis (strain DAOM 181602 / DAOM 197198 / MUCL 43194) TaxID=747089 RepID=A0A2P4QTT0_RHIID|nr:hypothetical protein GLOIN_2v1471016 [Rhizophagus irregularis DAOM 181602=DAOM 197198]POG81055.1 hypothetical protein GLOIN_2v1471016 [Rhizophagus irregularis DAOM 181602=DAOM 197198]|eukprot:XP_025187921.1 hypothetical protein GLOIN_2v1471016 [Rhizophagus irregularis DAOM 181602=DAOM 197198]
MVVKRNTLLKKNNSKLELEENQNFHATFWFFGHRILTAWTYRISEISSDLETEILDNGKKDFQFTYGIGWKWISGSWVDWMKPKELLRWFQNFPITFIDRNPCVFFIV